MNVHDLKSWMLHRYYRWRALVPAQVLYHVDHFRVRQLLRARVEVQEAAIERSLRHVFGVAIAHVPFYRREVPLSLVEIVNAPVSELLQCFPYISKGDVMANQRDFLDERLDTHWLLYATSHGSSGQGIGVWRDKRQTDIEKAFYAHQWGVFGFSFDKSRYLRIGCDASRPLDQSPVWHLGNRLMLSPDHLSAPHTSAIVTAINRFKPQYIHAYPSTALALADLLAPGQLDFQPRAVLLGSEPAPPAQLCAISRAFQCPVSISYGLTERTNLAFAQHAAGATSAYRFEPLYGLTEMRMTAGQPEIVGTSVWNDVMPLIRYCTGDFGQVDGRGRCEAIEGRLQEFVVDRDGNCIPGLALALEASSWEFVHMCQIRQCKRGEITLMVVPRHGALTTEQKAALAAAPRHYWGSKIHISVEEVSAIAPAPGGKRCFVVSDLVTRT